MTLGKKRNLCHEKCLGTIIIYMDDDDYYPPERVSHAFETLQKNTQALCAGSSEMYFYFKHIHKMYTFGPYGPNHATAATFAFRKELLLQTRFDDTASVAEEKKFLKGYTIPFVQLDSKKSILVFSHIHNSYYKKNMLEDTNIFIHVALIVFMCLYQLWRNILLSETLFDTQIVYIKDIKFYWFWIGCFVNCDGQWSASNCPH